MTKHLKYNDFANIHERDNFFYETQRIARKLLTKKSPLRKNLKVEYVPKEKMAICGIEKGASYIGMQSYTGSNRDVFYYPDSEVGNIMVPTFEIAKNFARINVCEDAQIMAEKVVAAICEEEQKLYDLLRSRNCRGGFLPIRSDLRVILNSDLGQNADTQDVQCYAWEEIGLAMRERELPRTVLFTKRVRGFKKGVLISEA